MALLTHRWLSLPFWLFAMACVLLPLGRVGAPGLDVVYGPSLMVSAFRFPGGAPQQQMFDRIVALDGRTVVKAADITAALAEEPARARHELTVERQGRRVTYPVASRRVRVGDVLGVHVALYVFGLFFLALATWVARQKPAGPQAEAFQLLAYTNTVYILGGAEYEISHWLWPAYLAALALVPFTYVFLAMKLLRPASRHAWVLAPAAGVGLATFVTFRPWGIMGADRGFFEVFAWLFGPLHIGLAAASNVLFVVLMAWGAWRSHAASLARRQFALIGTGAVVAFSPVIWVWLLALARGVTPDERYANLALLALSFFPLSVAVAVVRYRLFETERTVKRVLVYSLTITAMSSVYLGFCATVSLWLVDRSQWTSEGQFAVFVGMALLLQPLKTVIERAVDRFFAQDRLGLDEVLERVKKYSGLALESERLLARVADDARDAMRLSAAAIAVPDSSGWRISYAAGMDEAVGQMLGELPTHDAVIHADLAGFAAGVPVQLGDQTVALLLLGPKLSEQPLSTADFRCAQLLIAPLSGLIGYLRAMERHEQTNFELSRLHEQLSGVNLNVLKSAFGLIASHELRTPLTLVLGNAELLIDGKFGDLTERQSKAVERIHRYTLALTRSISDTFDLMRLLQGRVAFDFAPTDLRAICESLAADWQSEARSKEVSLQLQLPAGDSLPPVRVDRARLRQAVHHLLDNAFRHTEPGGKVIVSAQLAGDQVELMVKDTGSGMAASRLTAILGTEDEAQDQGNLGIGLLLVKANVEGLGGTLHLESRPGEGTTASVQLPAGDALALAPN